MESTRSGSVASMPRFIAHTIVQRLVAVMCLPALLLMTTPSYAQSYRTLCKKRCKVNKVICTDSTLPSTGGGSSNGTCATNCVDNYLDCDAACANSDPNCSRNCNNSLASCTSNCSSRTTGNQGRTSCNDVYSMCITSCDRIPDCTSDALCPSGVCANGRCEPACTTNTQCRRRLGPDGRCIKNPGATRGRCMLT